MSAETHGVLSIGDPTIVGEYQRANARALGLESFAPVRTECFQAHQGARVSRDFAFAIASHTRGSTEAKLLAGDQGIGAVLGGQACLNSKPLTSTCAMPT